MIRRELDSMLALYALNALPEDDVTLIETAVAGSAEVAARLEEHRRALASLARTAAVEPPPELKQRVIAAALAEQPAQPATPDLEPPQVVVPFARPSRRRSLGVGLAGLAAAAAVVLAVINVSGGSSGDQLVAEAVLLGPQGASIQVAMYDGGRLELTGSGVPTISEDQSYQLWFLDEDEEVRSAGVFSPHDDGTVDSALEGPLDDVIALAVTLEPAGGSDVATGAIELEGDVREISDAS